VHRVDQRRRAQLVQQPLLPAVGIVRERQRAAGGVEGGARLAEQLDEALVVAANLLFRQVAAAEVVARVPEN